MNNCLRRCPALLCRFVFLICVLTLLCWFAARPCTLCLVLRSSFAFIVRVPTLLFICSSFAIVIRCPVICLRAFLICSPSLHSTLAFQLSSTYSSICNGLLLCFPKLYAYFASQLSEALFLETLACNCEPTPPFRVRWGDRYFKFEKYFHNLPTLGCHQVCSSLRSPLLCTWADIRGSITYVLSFICSTDTHKYEVPATRA